MTTELTFDGCEVLRKLRSGPATNWYLGKQRSLGRSVVIKALSPNLSSESPFAAPLEREARLLAQFQHRCITQLYEFVRRPKTMWLVLEYVDGFSVLELCEKKPRLSVAGALAIVSDLLEALEYIHSRGVIHRDIQPKNLWMSREGELKLSSFFLAAEASAPPPPELLEGDSGYAVLKYMSPEQVLGEATDPSSDLFSVGALLYELVTGVSPFEAGDTRGTAQRIRHEAPPPLSQYCPDAPPALERILARSLQKLPADRFTDAREMATAVKQALAQLGHADTRNLHLETLSVRGMGEPAATPSNAPRSSNGRASMPSISPASGLTRPAPEARDPVFQSIQVYIGVLALFLGGSALIHWLTATESLPRPSTASTLPLVPENAGQLRIVCWPWANVFVDGQWVATTPIAETIPLSPGVHYVRLEHPNAKTEQRELNVAAGQRIQLEVRMTLTVALPETQETPAVRDAGLPSP